MRSQASGNPFAITKAVDFSDSEIEKTWVDWPDPGGFAQLMSVTSNMARVVKGGKGTGRTHIMRHFSASAQRIRAQSDPLDQVVKDGVLGIYALCSGLNTSRFHGRGIDPDLWQSIFAQYADVWLAQAAIRAFRIVTANSPPLEDVQSGIVRDVCRLVDSEEFEDRRTIPSLEQGLFNAQQRIDRVIGQMSLGKSFPSDFSLISVRGDLVFGIPMAIQKHFVPLREVIFLYLIDEFENFESPQQQYINSLIRESHSETSFMVGVRSFGLRTLQTLNATEENKRGSEFEEIALDRRYIGPKKDSYRTFCTRVIARRLVHQGHLPESFEAQEPDLMLQGLQHFFDSPSSEKEEDEIVKRYKGIHRPYLQRLRRQLLSVQDRTSDELGIKGKVDEIIDAIRVVDRPLLEKVNVFLIYRAWYRRKNLLEVARDISSTRMEPDSSGRMHPNNSQRAILHHYVTDLRAQLANMLYRQQSYTGIDAFIRLSDGLPRNLLVILKNVFSWAAFSGEEPFERDQISVQAQTLGVRDAAEWFFTDSLPMDQDGVDLRVAIHQLGEFFRKLRFSDKPVESSLASFSANLHDCSPRARELVFAAADRSLLIRAERGQKERNTGIVEPKFHLHRLLGTLWSLPVGRRGAIRFSAREINAIFDPEHAHDYNAVVNIRTRRMNAPFTQATDYSHGQQSFGFDNAGS